MLSFSRPSGVRVAGFGAASADRLIEGAQLVAPFGKDARWLRDRTGIESLRRLGPDEDLLDLACRASRDALDDAGVLAPDVVIVATCSQPPSPSAGLAARLVARLALSAHSVDLNAACAGFVHALGSAADLIRAGLARTALIVGAEQMSRLIDPGDLATSILFGDGAGAAVLTACPPEQDGIAPAAWYSDGSGRDLLCVPAAGRALVMNGPGVFRWALQELPRLLTRSLARARLAPSDIGVFVPHQANLRIIEPVRRAAGLEHTITADDVRTNGNTSAASIPMAIVALSQRAAVSGRFAMLLGYGAGLSAAAQVVRLP